VRAAIICNPLAGRRVLDGSLGAAIKVLEGAGWDVTVEQSEAQGDATRLAHEAVEAGVEVVLAAGGDGTLNEVVQALAGTETALGYLPYGTVNIWARELNIPRDPEGAARAIVDGRSAQIDLGVVDGRYFLLMASVGFDGEVLRRARSLEQHKHRLGILPYVAVGLTAAPLYRGADVELRYDGLIRRVQALMLVVGNTRLYGGLFRLTPNAVANDGWLDICIVRGRGPLALIRQSLPLLLSRSISHSDVELLRVKELAVQADTPLPIQADGELVGSTPAHFSIAPAVLRVIVPNDLASNLIA
jgi:YegS/Rv2252/BmrU family lipid kinase